MRIAVIAVVVLVAGCVTTSKIVSAGQDTYMISAANDACGNCAPPELRATEQAAAYCKTMGKQFTPKDTKERTFDIGAGHQVTLTFECK